MPTNTETKAQRVERLKREKNPWEGLEEIRRFGREGFSAIPPEWLGTYFRWWGVYTQGDGAGAIGGQGGEGKALPYFMVRIRIPDGLLRSHQLRTIADVHERYARATADITVRQNIQLHWVTIQALPELLDALWSVGLTTKGSCGDDTRNITGCPLAGVDAHEICDASPLALEANRFFEGNPDFYNLPRKFKVCITGCRVWCAYPEINDVGLTAIRRGSETGFSLRVGGGLSTDPHLALRLNAFVRWEQVVPVLGGRITDDEMRKAADLAEELATGELRTTNMQNLLIVNVPSRNVEILAQGLEAAGLRVGGSPFWRGAIACSGTEFCKLAITETKSFARWLVEELEERLPGFEQHLKLH